MRALVLINPKAGQGARLPFFMRRFMRLPAKEKFAPEALRSLIEHELAAHGIQTHFVFTAHSGQAIDLAREAAEEGYYAVIASGGDGTINEIVCGLAGTQVVLGILPCGTANVLASELGIPSEIAKACSMIAQGKVKTLDLGMLNGRPFTMMAGIGFDAHVVRRVDRGLKGRWGAFSYLFVLMSQLWRYTFRPIEAVTDTGEKVSGYYMFVQNASRYGSGFSASPDSRLDDGILELIVFPKRGFLKLVQYLLSDHKDSFDVLHRSIRSVDILTSHEIQIDGDYFCDGPAHIEIRRACLKVFVP